MRRRCPVFALIVAISLVLSGTAEASQSTNPPGAGAPVAQVTATGRVVDSQNRPIEGARVTLYGTTRDEMASLPKVEVVQEGITGAGGAYSFTLAQGAGHYQTWFLIARKEGLALGWCTWWTPADQQSDIVLGEPKNLGGGVVDEKGHPIAGAEVGIVFAVMGKADDRQLLAAPSLLRATTDNDGRFLFTNMPADATFEFLVQRPGRVTLNTFAQTIGSDSSLPLNIVQMASGQRTCQFSPGQAGIRLVLPLEARIEGVVVEKTSGKPVSGVKVTTRSDQVESGFAPPDRVTVAEDGTFRIRGLAAGSHTVQLATTSGQMAEWVADPVPVSLAADETKRAVRLELTKGGIIEVFVRDSDGSPVANAGLIISHMQRSQHFGGSTEENGLARIRVPPGPYRILSPYKPGYALQFRREQVTIEEGGTRRVELVLPIAPRLTGTVRDGTGNPLAGVTIIVTPVSGPGAATNADGEFALDWNPGLQGVAPLLVARDVARNLGEIIEVSEQTGRLDLTLKPGVIFTGTVQNHEGKPLPGARVLLTLRLSDRSIPLGPIEQVTTGEDGRFEVKAVPPGRQYEITTVAKGYGMHQISIDTSRVTDNRQDVGQFKLALADLTVSGIVVDSRGKPVAGATVSPVGRSLMPVDDVQTDVDGKFVMRGVPAGLILLRARTAGAMRMHGYTETEGGATDVRIVVSE